MVKRILSGVTVVALFFSWINYGVSEGVYSDSTKANGFELLFPIFVPIFLVVVSIVSMKNPKWDKLFIIGAIVGIIVAIISRIYFGINGTMFGTVSVKSSSGFGFWVSLIAYIAIIVLSLIGGKSGNNDSDTTGNSENE